MNFKDRLILSRAEYSVIKQNFLLNINSYGIGIHAFFEGSTDESFYGTYIRRRKAENLKLYTYDCGNKDGVYEVQQRLNYKEFADEISMFFVDKDIDDIIPVHRELNTDIYITTYYSIENFIVTKEIVEQVWAEIFKQGSSLLSKDIGQIFETSLRNFYNFATKIMVWVIYHRRKGNNPSLKNIDIKTFFEITPDYDVQLKINNSELIEILDSSGNVKTEQGWESEEQKIYQEIEKINPKTLIRGKYEIEFLVKYIKKMREDLTKSPKKVKIHIDITSENAIDLLGPRVGCPPCLDLYLKSKLNSI